MSGHAPPDTVFAHRVYIPLAGSVGCDAHAGAISAVGIEIMLAALGMPLVKTVTKA